MYIDVHIFADGVEVHQNPDTNSHVQRKRKRVSTIKDAVRDGPTNKCASTVTEPVTDGSEPVRDGPTNECASAVTEPVTDGSEPVRDGPTDEYASTVTEPVTDGLTNESAIATEMTVINLTAANPHEPVDLVVVQMLQEWAKEPKRNFVFGSTDDAGHYNLFVADGSCQLSAAFLAHIAEKPAQSDSSLHPPAAVDETDAFGMLFCMLTCEYIVS